MRYQHHYTKIREIKKGQAIMALADYKGLIAGTKGTVEKMHADYIGVRWSMGATDEIFGIELNYFIFGKEETTKE